MKINEFITKEEKEEIISFVNSINYKPTFTNEHIKEVADKLCGVSYMFDITKTNVSSYLSNFQSSNNICDYKLYDIFYILMNRISDRLNIPIDNVFLQILDMNSGGVITPHYDTSIDGYINYKCNISVLSEDYTINIDKDIIEVAERDLYSFEASLYKHWTENKFTKRRILLSYGFGLTYEQLGRNDNDPRVRLSKRINKYFQL
jgi:hypothetical protein